jgi:hypothetical protein
MDLEGYENSYKFVNKAFDVVLKYEVKESHLLSHCTSLYVNDMALKST